MHIESRENGQIFALKCPGTDFRSTSKFLFFWPLKTVGVYSLGLCIIFIALTLIFAEIGKEMPYDTQEGGAEKTINEAQDQINACTTEACEYTNHDCGREHRQRNDKEPERRSRYLAPFSAGVRL